MGKKFNRKKEEELNSETEYEMGEFRLKKGYGKHLLGENPLLNIKGKPHKRVAVTGDVVVCPLHILANFMDKFERVDVLPEEEKEDVVYIKQHKGGGRYNVLDPVTGIKVNDDFLTKEDADELIASERQEEEEK